jgi:hypothetical protein
MTGIDLPCLPLPRLLAEITMIVTTIGVVTTDVAATGLIPVDPMTVVGVPPTTPIEVALRIEDSLCRLLHHPHTGTILHPFDLLPRLVLIMLLNQAVIPLLKNHWIMTLLRLAMNQSLKSKGLQITKPKQGPLQLLFLFKTDWVL